MRSGKSIISWIKRQGARYAPAAAAGLLLLSTGCNRTKYRLAADREVVGLVQEKSSDPRWEFCDFSPRYDVRARYFDPTNPDCPPMPQDDPASHVFMHYVDNKNGWPCWHCNGDRWQIENPNWRNMLGEYTQIEADGSVRLDLPTAILLAYIHSGDYRQQLETIYLSALDVSTERFRFDVQYFGGLGPSFTGSGKDRIPPAGATVLRNDMDGRFTKTFTTGGQFLIGFANSFVWNFTGPDTNQANTLLNFALTQPLLRGGGRELVLERLTRVERGLLSNLRAMAQYRQGFYTNIAIGVSGVGGPARQGGVFGGTGLDQFSGQGGGGFGGIGGGLNLGGFRFGAGGAGGAAGGGGFAGGGVANVGGYIGLLQQVQQIRNARDNLNLQERTLALLQANYDAGLIDAAQVLQFQQNIQTGRANLIQQQNGLDTALDTFKRTNLGLPPNLPMKLDEEMIGQFQLITTEVTEAQYSFNDLVDLIGNLPEEPTVEQLRGAVERLLELREGAASVFDVIKEDLDRMNSLGEQRTKYMTDAEKEEYAKLKTTLAENLESLRRRYDDTLMSIQGLSGQIDPMALAAAANSIVAQAGVLAGLIQETSLIQARARLESIVLDRVELDPLVGLEIARANRLDWMNARASLVDSWRLIAFNANALESNLTVTVSGDMGTVGDNPVKFQSTNGSIRAGLRWDPPFTRRLERNNYRSVLIDYQQSRRGLIQFQDQIHQTMRQTMRTLEQLEINLELQRSAVDIAIRRVDQTREILNQPPPPSTGTGGTQQLGPTAALNLITALSDLRDSQNNFMGVWLNHYATRMSLMRELGVMQIDERGLWIDEPLNDVLARMGVEATKKNAEEVPLPPEVPEKWMNDAMQEGEGGEDAEGELEAPDGEEDLAPPGDQNVPIPAPKERSSRKSSKKGTVAKKSDQTLKKSIAEQMTDETKYLQEQQAYMARMEKEQEGQFPKLARLIRDTKNSLTSKSGKDAGQNGAAAQDPFTKVSRKNRSEAVDRIAANEEEFEDAEEPPKPSSKKKSKSNLKRRSHLR